VFDHVTPAPPDPILGLVERFVADPNPTKLDLTAGVYRDETGKTPIFDAVRTAEFRYLEAETTKSYLPIDGPKAFGDLVDEMVFGADARAAGLVTRTSQTPGGTGALAVAGHFLARQRPDRKVWISAPTWPNHKPIFETAGLAVEQYRYYDPATRQMTFDAMVEDLRGATAGDTVVLHGCCHNPTGRDLDLDQWSVIGDLLVERELTGLIDLAYLGLAEGIETDRAFLAPLAAKGVELLVCTSFSKNMGLYRERVGGLTVITDTDSSADAVQSNIKATVRAIYSNPPSLGGGIVATVLGDPELKARWLEELAALRDRLNGLRVEFAKAASEAGLSDLTGIAEERGMFCLTGITPEQVERLRADEGIYVLGSGRANVAALDRSNIPRVVAALAAVTRS
jgi:aspartate/tyrosine/aromatic aminotransferase